MRRWNAVVLSLCLLGAARAQPLTVSYQGTTYTAAADEMKIDGRTEKIWYFSMQGSEYLILEKSTFLSLLKNLEKQRQILETCEQKLAVQEVLLESYEKFEKTANRHIETQTRLIENLDSLYVGYRELYQDLKGILGLSRLSFMASLGLIDPPVASIRPAAMLGMSVGTWQAYVQFGQSFRGFHVGFRWP